MVVRGTLSELIAHVVKGLCGSMSTGAILEYTCACVCANSTLLRMEMTEPPINSTFLASQARSGVSFSLGVNGNRQVQDVRRRFFAVFSP
jgi:hypothetical protein